MNKDTMRITYSPFHFFVPSPSPSSFLPPIPLKLVCVFTCLAQVVVSTTSKEATESEVRTVVAVDGATLTLDTALEFEHLGESW